MGFISTRDPECTLRKLLDILLGGFASDGGLYLPVEYPQVGDAALTCWRSVLVNDGYIALAVKVTSLFVSDIPLEDLRGICARVYTYPRFSDPDIVPVTKLEDRLYIGHLSMGPTAAFKDIAVQLLDEFFEYELARRGETLNILSATSGDTGSSVEYAMRGCEGISMFTLTPAGWVTAFQQTQMFGLQDVNIHNVALGGVFDNCQDIVKAVSDDLGYKASHHTGATSSINWARLMTQTAYYVSSWIRVTDGSGVETDNTQEVSFSVPTDNLGDICTDHIARQMGVPIDHLIVATNESDVLDEFFCADTYRVRSAAETQVTSSPPMDISRASSFERFIFNLLGRDAERTADLSSVKIKRGGFSLTADPIFPETSARYGFLSGCSTHTDRVEATKNCWERLEVMVDPYTVGGTHATCDLVDQVHAPIVCLETTLPVKFSEIILETTRREPDCPERSADIMNASRRVTELPNNADVVKKFIDDSVA